jgi:flagellar biosynthesis GTPase FlhF
MQAYEHRIRTLEALLQKNYHNQMSSSRSQLFPTPGNEPFPSTSPSENQTTAVGSLNASSPLQILPRPPTPAQQYQQQQQQQAEQNASYQNTIRNLQERLAASDASAQKSNQMVEDLNRQLQDMESLLQDTQTSYQDELQHTQQRLGEAERQTVGWKNRAGELEREVEDLRSLVDIKEREKGVWVVEVERAAGLLRELFGLLDACGEALIVRPKNGLPLSSTPTNATAPISHPTINTAVPVANGYVVQSPTSPPVPGSNPIMYASPRGSTPSGNNAPVGIPRSSSSASTSSSTPPSSYFSHAGAPSNNLAMNGSNLLASLRSDTKEIRRRLRELEDDIRCQTLQLVGLREEIGLNPDGEVPTTVEGSSVEEEIEGEESDEPLEGSGILSGSGTQTTGGARSGTSSAFLGSSRGPGVSGSTSPHQENIDDWKQRVQDLTSVIQDLTKGVEDSREELSKAQDRINELERESEGLKAKVSELEAELERQEQEFNDREVDFKRQSLQSIEKLESDLKEKSNEEREELLRKLEEVESLVEQEKTKARKSQADLIQSQQAQEQERARYEEIQNELLRQRGLEEMRTQLVKWMERVEDWQIVCRLAMEQFKIRHEALVRISEAWTNVLESTSTPAVNLVQEIRSYSDLGSFARFTPLSPLSDGLSSASSSALMSPGMSSMFDSLSGAFGINDDDVDPEDDEVTVEYDDETSDGTDVSQETEKAGGERIAKGGVTRRGKPAKSEVLREAYMNVLGAGQGMDVLEWAQIAVERLEAYAKWVKSLQGMAPESRCRYQKETC